MRYGMSLQEEFRHGLWEVQVVLGSIEQEEKRSLKLPERSRTRHAYFRSYPGSPIWLN